MTGHQLSTRSMQRLEGVHPHLVQCVLSAIEETTVDFTVICGVRSVAEQAALYAKGRSAAELRRAGLHDVVAKPTERKVTWTLNSNHFVRPSSGFGHAVDLAPYVYGAIKWDDWSLFREVADVMLAVAARMSIPLEWGGDWVKPDGPHFQLPRDYKA